MGTSVSVTGKVPIFTNVATSCKTMTRAVNMANPPRRLLLSVLFHIFKYLLLLFRFQPGYSARLIIQQVHKTARDISSSAVFFAHKDAGPVRKAAGPAEKMNFIPARPPR